MVDWEQPMASVSEAHHTILRLPSHGRSVITPHYAFHPALALTMKVTHSSSASDTATRSVDSVTSWRGCLERDVDGQADYDCNAIFHAPGYGNKPEYFLCT